MAIHPVPIVRTLLCAGLVKTGGYLDLELIRTGIVQKDTGAVGIQDIQ